MSSARLSARVGATVVFFLTGAVFATWASRIPTIQDRLHLSPGALSLALLGSEAGALIGLGLGARIVVAVGSPAGLRLGFAVYPTALAAAAIAGSLPVLAACLAIMGTANAVIDVAINVQGVELERRRDRPLLSGLHSAHSFGVLGGGAAGGLLAAAGVAPVTHFAGVAALALAGSQLAATGLVREPGGQGPGRRERRRALPTRPLAMLGVLAFAAFFVEGAANDWSAVLLRSVHHASPATAAAAFMAFSLALALTRSAGDRIIDRHGRVACLRGAALVAAAGVLTVVTAPGAAIALAGWTVLGVGIAPIAPMLLGAAPAAVASPAPAAIATVSRIGYAGSFAGPPLIGALAQLTSLPWALATLAPGALAVAALAGAAARGGL